jgi:Kef-type K+ transport system membrane component KefB
MIENNAHPAVTVFIVGTLTVTAMLVKAGLKRIGLPALIGFLAVGLLIRSLDNALTIFNAVDFGLLLFLGKVGLVTLLFRVGLESNIQGLLEQLRSASLVWLADVAVSSAVGYVTAFYLLKLGMVASLVVATAFTATSVGISVAVWQEMDALGSPDGELLIDVAELDDISAIVLMALLFTVVPQLTGSSSEAAAVPLIAVKAGLFLLKLLGFGLFCFLFSHWIEKPVTRFFRRLESEPDPMLTIAGIGFVVAALAEWLGFSMAIGAFFAGLIFSRDPETVKMESSFVPIYDFFSPFFFISIGLQMDPAVLGSALGVGAVLVAAAVGSKGLANGLSVYWLRGRRAALLIGASMIPRAEISLVVMQRAHAMGAGIVSSQIYNAMIMVSAVTCMLAPFTVRPLLRKQSGSFGKPNQ